MNRTLDHEIIRKLRRLFRALGTQRDETLKRFGLSAAERTVLEFLYPDAALTVPQIARRCRASRQHIQVNVNSLGDQGLLLQTENPDHARSPLLRLTNKGVTTFAAIEETEKDLIDRLFLSIPAAEKVVAARVLGQLLDKL